LHWLIDFFLFSLFFFLKTMLVKTVFDTQTQEKVYAICDPSTQQCGFVTYSILTAIKAGQCKSLDEVLNLAK
jgi:TRAP-type mannitol/chloroaromatic compound transport system permease small subunit